MHKTENLCMSILKHVHAIVVRQFKISFIFIEVIKSLILCLKSCIFSHYLVKISMSSKQVTGQHVVTLSDINEALKSLNPDRQVDIRNC